MKRSVAVLLCLMLAGCGVRSPPGVTTLLYGTPYGPNHPFSLADREWIAFVERRSGGHLHIRPIWSGALLSSEDSMLELRHGVADIGLITPIYVRGGVHLIRVQAGFYSGARTYEEQTALYRCMLKSSPEFAHELAGLKVLAVQGGNLPGIVTRDRPVRSLADLQGMRLRAPAELLPVLAALGADPVNMPMADVYSALAKGTIDGVVAPADTLKSLHFGEISHYYTALAVPRGAYPARAMSLRRWRTLSDAERAILQEGIPVWEAALARQTRRAQEAGLAAGKAAGITMLPVSASEQAAFDRLYLEEAGKSARTLQRFGIDGQSVFRAARASIGPEGVTECRED